MIAVLLAAATPAEAEAFLRRVYAPYVASENGGDWFHRRAPSVFAPALLKQIRADQKATEGEVDSIGVDPFCNCQDGGPLKRLAITISPDGPGRALGTVRFVNMTTPQAISFKLVSVGGQWRIADIGSKDVPSIVVLLRRAAADR